MHCLSRTPRSHLVNSYSDVKESDETKRESYEATWLDLVMETRPEHKITLTERDLSRKETFERKQAAHFVVRRFPTQTLWIGQEGAKMKEYHIPYKKSVLPIPMFVPRDITVDEMNREPNPSFLQSIMDFEKNRNETKEPSPVMKHMPPGLEFRASRLISPPSDAQRRE
ncbi:telethonin [Brachyhypopomus gauderio]|uniref:telethonin n=1 Tax=Brachyhypopomus gauderio TaxID=698409 RepID=UPI00404180BD